MDQIGRKSKVKDSFPIPQKSHPHSYKLAYKLLSSARDYANISRIFSSIRSGEIEAHRIDESFILKYKHSYEGEYSALEALQHGQEPYFDLSSLLHGLLRGEHVPIGLIAAFSNLSRIKKGRVTYKYEPSGILAIINEIGQRDQIIPDDFLFPWGSAFETHALINSLHVRCLYHLVAIHFATQKYSIPGGFESSLVLQISKTQLIEDFEGLADIGRDKIVTFIDFLTYGTNSRTPDPALQPIYKAKNEILLIPCAHVITSNTQRNILSLLARVAPSAFDAQSKKFEIRMCSNISAEFKQWPNRRENCEIRAKGQMEEFDLIVIDPTTRFICALELRWMIQPGDVREVINRIKVCREKITQLNRKLSFLRKNIKEILPNAFGITQSTNNPWRIEGFVVIQGFGGHTSEIQSIPLITASALRIGLEEISTLPTLYEWARELKWLPVNGKHFFTDKETMEIHGTNFTRDAFYMAEGQLDYAEHVRDSARSKSQENVV